MCHMCHKRRQLVLSSGLWHPGCDVGDDIPLAQEIEDRMDELEVISYLLYLYCSPTKIFIYGYW